MPADQDRTYPVAHRACGHRHEPFTVCPDEGPQCAECGAQTTADVYAPDQMHDGWYCEECGWTTHLDGSATRPCYTAGQLRQFAGAAHHLDADDVEHLEQLAQDDHHQEQREPVEPTTLIFEYYTVASALAALQRVFSDQTVTVVTTSQTVGPDRHQITAKCHPADAWIVRGLMQHQQPPAVTGDAVPF